MKNLRDLVMTQLISTIEGRVRHPEELVPLLPDTA